MKSLRFPIIAAMALTVVGAAACGSSQSTTTSAVPDRKLALTRAGGAARPSADSGVPAVYPQRPTRYVLDGALPNLGVEAPVWRLNPPAVDLAAVQRIADALGLSGTPIANASGWTLRAGNAQLNVDRSNGKLLVGYSLPGPGAVSGSSGSGGSSSTSGVATPPDAGVNQPALSTTKPSAPVPSTSPAEATTPETVPVQAPPVDVPSAADAQTIAQRLLDRSGVLAGQKWSIAVSDGAGVAVSCAAGEACPAPVTAVYSRTVAFSLVLDGKPIDDINWSVTIGEHRRVDSVDGEWATATPIGSYDLRSTTDVFADLQNGKAQYSEPQATGSAEGSDDVAPVASPPTPINPAGPAGPTTPSTAPAPLDVHITGVSLGLAGWNATGDDGKPVTDLVPTYRFRAVVDGGTPYDIDLVALDPSMFSIRPTPVPPAGSGSGSESGSGSAVAPKG